MSFGGILIRFGSVILRFLELCCSAVILGIFSYFLAVLSDHDLHIATKWEAVEGISGAAVVYSICGTVLTLCLGGVAFFGFLAIVLDICFVGGFIAIAWFTRKGADSCSGYVETPLGNGPSNSKSAGYGSDGFGFGKGENVTYYPNLHTACELNTACFAVAIIACVLFAISAVWNVMMVRHHKKEKKYGPGPSNNYTSGSGRRPFWKRNRGMQTTTKDAEAATAPAAARTSAETGYTGTTAGGAAYSPEPKYGEPGYAAQPTYPAQGGNYYSQQNAGHF